MDTVDSWGDYRIGALALAVKGVKVLLIQGLIAFLLGFVHGKMPQ